jgi:hypothetical protein
MVSWAAADPSHKSLLGGLLLEKVQMIAEWCEQIDWPEAPACSMTTV